MKKLVVIACVALAVVSAKAAMVDWKYEINGAAGGAATEFTGYTVYLVDKAYYDGLGGEITKESITSTGKYLTSDTLAQTGKSGKGANTKYVFTAEGHLSDDGLTKGTSYDYYLVLVNGDNYMSQAYSYTARDAADSVDMTSIKTSVASTAISMTPFSTGSTPTPGPGPIPEPTSGLLLLVGGAMLALRRKQK